MSALKLYSRILTTLLVVLLISLYLILVLHKYGHISFQEAIIIYLVLVPLLILLGVLLNLAENRKKKILRI